jgi:hypothetical protein
MAVRTMCHEVFENTLLVVHGPKPASAEEWTAYTEEGTVLHYGGILVVTDIAYPGPDAKQRAQGTAAVRRRGVYPHIAVVTASAVHRCIVTAFSWMQRGNVTAYHPSRLREAMDYAGVSPARRTKVLLRVHDLARELESTWIPRSVRWSSAMRFDDSSRSERRAADKTNRISR